MAGGFKAGLTDSAAGKTGRSRTTTKKTSLRGPKPYARLVRIGGRGSHGSALERKFTAWAPPDPGRGWNASGRSRLGGGRNRSNRLQDLRSDLVRVALRVRTAILKIALVAVIGEAVRYADRRAAVGDAIAELVDRRGLVLAGQPQMIIRAIDRDVIGPCRLERGHQLFEILLAADFPHVGGGEVGMHAGAIPIGVAERLAVIFDVDAVRLGQALHQIAGHPHFVSGLLGSLAEDLEFPLALRHFGVDAFVVDAGGEAQIEMLLDDLARNCADIGVADAGVIRALRRRIAGGGKAERTAVLEEEIFLLKAEPGAGIVEDGGALVGGMRGLAVGHHHFAHYQNAVGARAIRKHSDRFENAIRAFPFGLHGRASIEAPQRKLLQRRK